MASHLLELRDSNLGKITSIDDPDQVRSDDQSVTADGIRTELLRIADLCLKGGIEELQNVPQATLVFCLCRQRGEMHYEVDCGLVQISSLFYLEVANNEFFQLIVKVCYGNSNWQTGIKQVSDQPVTGYTRSEGNIFQVS